MAAVPVNDADPAVHVVVAVARAWIDASEWPAGLPRSNRARAAPWVGGATDGGGRLTPADQR